MGLRRYIKREQQNQNMTQKVVDIAYQMLAKVEQQSNLKQFIKKILAQLKQGSEQSFISKSKNSSHRTRFTLIGSMYQIKILNIISNADNNHFQDSLEECFQLEQLPLTVDFNMNTSNAKVRIFLKGQQFVIKANSQNCQKNVQEFLKQKNLPLSLSDKIITQIKTKLSQVSHSKSIPSPSWSPSFQKKPIKKLIQPFKQLVANQQTCKNQILNYKQKSCSQDFQHSMSFGSPIPCSQNQSKFKDISLSDSSKTFEYNPAQQEQQSNEQMHPIMSDQASQCYEMWSSRIKQKMLEKQQSKDQIVIPQLKLNLKKGQIKKNINPKFYQDQKKWTIQRNKRLQNKRDNLFYQEHEQYKAGQYDFKKKRLQKNYMKQKQQLKFDHYYKDSYTFKPKITKDKVYEKVSEQINLKALVLQQIIQQQNMNHKQQNLKTKSKNNKPPFKA